MTSDLNVKQTESSDDPPDNRGDAATVPGDAPDDGRGAAMLRPPDGEGLEKERERPEPPASELFLKTEQLLYFRLTFALASLGVSLLVGYFAGGEFALALVVILIFAVAVYSLVGLDLLKRGRVDSDKELSRLNGALIGLDIASLT